MIVRAATKADASAIAEAVHDQPLLLRYGSTCAGLTKHLENAIGVDGVLVAEDGGIIGFAWFQLCGFLGVGGYLKLIATKTGTEGRGVGARLLDEVERIVAVETPHMFLLVSDFNAAAQRFYERRGYVEHARLPALVKPDIDELLFYRRLSASSR